MGRRTSPDALEQVRPHVRQEAQAARLIVKRLKEPPGERVERFAQLALGMKECGLALGWKRRVAISRAGVNGQKMQLTI